jgi:hypothetical protein
MEQHPPPVPVKITPMMSNDNDVSKTVTRVAAKAKEWQTLVPLKDKIHLLQQVLDNTIQFEQEWNAVAFAARGIRNVGDTNDDNQGCARADVILVGPAKWIDCIVTALFQGRYRSKCWRRSRHDDDATTTHGDSYCC